MFKTYQSPVQCKHDNPELEKNCQNLHAKYCGSLFSRHYSSLALKSFFFLFVLAICLFVFFALISRSCDPPFYFMHSVRIKLNV